jgi:2-(1,2-epoxy-1,2-dihydrophenyl)acetyl-CoA isomerase
MGSSYETVKVERAGALATVVMSRPQARNSVNSRMMLDLYDALGAVAADPEVRVVVLRGEGRDFCPGADIGHYAGGGDRAGGGPAHGIREFDISVLLHEMPKPTLAAVRGGCAGAGFGWASACDLRVADAGAKFNVAFLDVGVAGDMGVPWTLPRIVGAAKARELCFFPGKFDAAEARAIGFVSRVWAAEAFEAELDALTARLAAAAPLALAMLKANFVQAEKMGFADYIALESEKHTRIFRSEDTAEAFDAYAQKRPPVFKGR